MMVNTWAHLKKKNADGSRTPAITYASSADINRLQARALLLEGWARDFMSHVPSKNAKDRAADKAAQLSADVSRQAARVQSMQSI